MGSGICVENGSFFFSVSSCMCSFTPCFKNVESCVVYPAMIILSLVKSSHEMSLGMS